MSKAFTRENDDAPEPGSVRRPPAQLPPGVRNHVTPDGLRRWKSQLEHLIEHARPQLAHQTDPSSREQLDRLEDQIARLQDCLQSAVSTPPPAVGETRVRFGAWVEVRDSAGETNRYRLVGVEETDPDQGHISWLSPLAKALLNHRPGDSTRLRLPAGETTLTIQAVDYVRDSAPH
jgi:transcription elongation factor GreB